MKTEDNVRPWGIYEILLDSESTKVKKITVKPGGKLSLQYHLHRSEHWIMVKGTGLITIADKTLNATAGDYFFIPCNAQHRIENTGATDLIFIETQTGDYFGEDDIVRVEDIYNRA